MQVIKNDEIGCELQILRDTDGNVWFRGKTVAEALGYSNTEKAVRMHVDDDDKCNFSDFECQPVVGGGQHVAKNAKFINESGLYSLVLSSKLPQAKLFKRWITKEVLPSIRKTGKYSIKQPNSLKVIDEIDELTTISNEVSGMNIGSNRKTALYDYLGEACLSGNLDDATGKVKQIPDAVKKINNLRQPDKIKNVLFERLFSEFKHEKKKLPDRKVIKEASSNESFCNSGYRNYDPEEHGPDKSFF